MTDRELMQMALDALESSCVHDRFNVMPLLEERLGQPKREWVGLTEDEAADCWKSSDIVVSVEAKLKEKNT